jgi:hypothetical protein
MCDSNNTWEILLKYDMVIQVPLFFGTTIEEVTMLIAKNELFIPTLFVNFYSESEFSI